MGRPRYGVRDEVRQRARLAGRDAHAINKLNRAAGVQSDRDFEVFRAAILPVSPSATSSPT